ncbi:hypothetical protein [uncultured Campylobacter sp.]|uniref:hypothetical protein n=1 Tax=uncultured Campylobacter sp. TaxID=218934 RepID=UPI002637574F|nr:hypothetical protein [uncultured Campylobacter sp.]
MGYLRLAELRTSQNRGEIPHATKAHKSVAAISQVSPSQNRYLATSSVDRRCKADSTTDAIRQTVHGEQH